MRSALVVAAILVTLNVPLPAGARSQEFPRPAEMEHQIRFWRSIFADYSKYQVVIHDTVDLDKVYTVLDYRGYVDAGWPLVEVERAQKEGTEQEMARLRALFIRLQEGATDDELSPDDRRIKKLFAHDQNPYRFSDAADSKRLRSQRGIRERFSEGHRRARAYFPEMERIFREEGLPVQLTRLPLIESCFNLHAYSKVGAAGVWQFMPSTGRRFLDVNDHVDERRDPIASTRAAARFLRENYERLGSWPLAITAYNHGPGGMSRAMRETGTSDIATIVRVYNGPAFGFASRNFYAEFLAALDVDRHADAYFGATHPEERPETREHDLEQPVGIEVAARLAGTDADTLAGLNPALLSPVVTGRRHIPSGYRLRLPAQGSAGFDDRLDELVAETRVTRVATPKAPEPRARSKRNGAVATHRVKRGQTLSGIAQRYGVSLAALKTANGLGRRGTVKTGQVLRIPGRT